jgi:hypothetical protein
VHGELVDQGGGGVVEQMGVVDQQRPHTGEPAERLVERAGSGQQVGEGGEREVPGARCSGDPGAVGAADGLGDQPGLAPAGRPGHHQAAPGAAQRVADQVEFALPAGERPGRPQGRRVLLVRLGGIPSQCRHDNRSRATQT